MAVGIAVDGGAHAVLLRDELHHHAFERHALVVLHYALRAAEQPFRVGGLCGKCQPGKAHDRGQRNAHASSLHCIRHCFLLLHAVKNLTQ